MPEDPAAEPAPPPRGTTGPARPLPARLGIAAGSRVALLHAPEGFDATLAPLPPGVEVAHGLRRGDRVDVIVGFVTARDHLERNVDWLTRCVAPGGAFWVAWPKRAAAVATDMSDHAVRAVALPRGWVDVKVCSIDATWTALRLVRRAVARPAPR